MLTSYGKVPYTGLLNLIKISFFSIELLVFIIKTHTYWVTENHRTYLAGK